MKKLKGLDVFDGKSGDLQLWPKQVLSQSSQNMMFS